VVVVARYAYVQVHITVADVSISGQSNRVLLRLSENE
jgi:hypothetical protein